MLRAVLLMPDGRIAKQVGKSNQFSRAHRAFRSMHAAYAAGALIARPDELVRIEDGFAVTEERVEGESLSELVAAGELTAREAGALAGRFLHAPHGVTTDAEFMRDIRENIRGMIEHLSDMLSGPLGEHLKELVTQVPAMRTILHGDFHPGNVIVSAEGPRLIDADTVCVGHPIFDLGLSCSILVCEAESNPRQAERFVGLSPTEAREFWDGLLGEYLAGRDGGQACKIEKSAQLIGWIVLLSRMRASGIGDASAGEYAVRLLEAISHIRSLAEQVDTLAFDV